MTTVEWEPPASAPRKTSVCDMIYPPTAWPPDRPTVEDRIPTSTVTAVPSGTYHGQASPGSTRHGTPSTTGVIASTLTMMATTTSRWRTLDHHPPSRSVPSKPPDRTHALP